MEFVSAIVLAGGSGERFNASMPKQFLKLAGKSILEHTTLVFEKNSLISEIIIVTHQNYIDFVKDLLADYSKVRAVVAGGKTRKDSSFNGLKSLSKDSEKVLIHDAVRPFVTNRIIKDCVDGLDSYSAIDVVIPSSDTIVKVDGEEVIKIPERKTLMRGQTPQAFIVEEIRRIHEVTENNSSLEVTDDCGLFKEFSSKPIGIVLGEQSNIKITYPEDMVLADNLFKMKQSVVSETFDVKGISGSAIAVFGGTNGIGQNICDAANKAGAKAYSFGRSNGVNIVNPKDVKESLMRVWEKEGKIDFIVNTAALLNIGRIYERSYNEIEEELKVNYFGNIVIAKESFPFLKASKGSLLFFSSSSYTRGREKYSTYSSAKAAVVNLTQALSEEFYSDDIRVNVMCPERTKTHMRLSNFGKEKEGSLLCPKRAANISLSVLTSNLTGQVIEARRK